MIFCELACPGWKLKENLTRMHSLPEAMANFRNYVSLWLKCVSINHSILSVILSEFSFNRVHNYNRAFIKRIMARLSDQCCSRHTCK